MKDAEELRSQARRYRWLARNINDTEVKTVLEAVAIELEKRDRASLGTTSPSANLQGRTRLSLGRTLRLSTGTWRMAADPRQTRSQDLRRWVQSVLRARGANA